MTNWSREKGLRYGCTEGQGCKGCDVPSWLSMVWELAEGERWCSEEVSLRVLIKGCRWKPQHGRCGWGYERCHRGCVPMTRDRDRTIIQLMFSNNEQVRAGKQTSLLTFLPTLEQLNVSISMCLNQNTGVIISWPTIKAHCNFQS